MYLEQLQFEAKQRTELQSKVRDLEVASKASQGIGYSLGSLLGMGQQQPEDERIRANQQTKRADGLAKELDELKLKLNLE